MRVDGRDVTEAIRLPEVSRRVSEVSAHPGVREEMVAAQRALLSSGGWVSDGRDVGSVVCPGADLKVFLTASLEERARRRRVELAARGVEVDQPTVLEDVRRRDHLDTTRDTSPLRGGARRGRDRLLRDGGRRRGGARSWAWSRRLRAASA